MPPSKGTRGTSCCPTSLLLGRFRLPGRLLDLMEQGNQEQLCGVVDWAAPKTSLVFHVHLLGKL